MKQPAKDGGAPSRPPFRFARYLLVSAVLIVIGAACGGGAAFPDKHGTTRTQICRDWNTQLAALDGDAADLAEQIRLGATMADGADLDVVGEYLEYTTEEC